MPPWRPAEEERAENARAVDERGAEVGLLEDERGQRERDRDDAERRPPLVHAVAALGHEAREGEDERELAELRGLEVEEADLDPALRPAHLLGEDEHGEQQDERDAIERDAQPPVDVGVHHHRQREEEPADGDVDQLPEDVVVGIADHVVARHRLEHPEPVCDERSSRQEQQVVDVSDECTELPGRRLRAGGLLDSVDRVAISRTPGSSPSSCRARCRSSPRRP